MLEGGRDEKREGRREERGWASLCSEQSNRRRVMGRTGLSFYFVRFWLHLQGRASKWWRPWTAA